jgi:type IV pilus assembly protein PilQ
LRLSVTPQISDAGTVILRVVAENNSINTTIAIAGTPGIDTQRMQTEVLVPDGGTTVVGGVLADNESEIQNRTPGLASLPVVGNLFKRKATSRQTNEILFFITPSTTTRSVSIPQPVPLGNPPSNTPAPMPMQQSAPQTNAPAQTVPNVPPTAPTGRRP